MTDEEILVLFRKIRKKKVKGKMGQRFLSRVEAMEEVQELTGLTKEQQSEIYREKGNFS